MVEFTAAEQNKEKIMKRNEDSLRDVWDNINKPAFTLQGSPKEKRKRKDARKYLKRLQSKTSLTWEGKQPSKSRKHLDDCSSKPETPKQDKPKEKHAKTHSNQIEKIKDKEKLLKATREK